MDLKEDANDSVFRRLLELKTMYSQQKKDNNLTSYTGMEIYHSKLTPDPSSDEDEIDEVDDDEDYKKEEIPVGGITTGKKRILTKTDESKVSGTALQSTIKNIIDKNGSSCHFDTIVEHVKRTWQRDITIRKPDGNLYGHSDCKRAVTANLRTRANNKFVFVRDREHEGCFLITPDDYQDNDTIVLKTKPLEIMIGEAIEEHGGTCYLDDMYSYVENNWSGGPKLSKDELQLNVNICLGTNPKFVEEPENSEYFQFSNKKKRRQQQQSGEKKIRTKRTLLSTKEEKETKKKRQHLLQMLPEDGLAEPIRLHRKITFANVAQQNLPKDFLPNGEKDPMANFCVSIVLKLQAKNLRVQFVANSIAKMKLPMMIHG